MVRYTFLICSFCMVFSATCQQAMIADTLTNGTDGTMYSDPIKFEGQLFTGVVVSHYENGMPLYRKEIVKGRADGLWIEWYPEGIIKYRANWKEGLGYGLWEYFYPTGTIRQKEFYVRDQPAGIQTEYDSSGQIVKESYYIEGQAINYKQ